MDHSQLVFNVHVLKLAMWKADDDFLNEMRGTVEDHFHSLAPWAQEECEMVLTLLDYRARRERFVLLGLSCERIDRAIRDWCVLPEPEGDRSVLDCQYFLSLRGQRLLDELPDYTADVSYVLVPWDRIVTDVLERVGEPEPQDQATLAGYAREFMIRILRRKQRTSGHYLGLGLVFVALALLLVTLVTSGSFAVRLCCRLFGEGRFLSSFLDGLLAAGTLLGGFCASVIVFLIGRRKAALDYGMARREVLKLIRVAPLPVDQLATIIEEREDEKSKGSDVQNSIFAAIVRPCGCDRPAKIEFCTSEPGCALAAEPDVCVFHSVPIIEPGVPRVPKPAGPSCHWLSSKSACCQPSAGFRVVYRQTNASSSAVGSTVTNTGGLGIGAKSLAFVLSRPAYLAHTAWSYSICRNTPPTTGRAVKPTFLAVFVWYQSVIGERSGVSFKNRNTGSTKASKSARSWVKVAVHRIQSSFV
jgi:hypothetical protein